jgi:hypothetical protein
LERGASATTDQTVFNQLPRLLNAAERKLAQYLKILGQIEVFVDPVGLTAGSNVVTKPDRWRKTVSMNYGTGASKNSRKSLYPRSLEYCQAYWPDDSQVAPPTFYADYDQYHWLIVETPDQTYPLQALCYMLPVLLDSANQQNFWSIQAPNALLYGALLEATPFLKDDPRLPLWQNMWQAELTSLAGQDLQKVLDRSAQRSSA